MSTLPKRLPKYPRIPICSQIVAKLDKEIKDVPSNGKKFIILNEFFKRGEELDLIEIMYTWSDKLNRFTLNLSMFDVVKEENI